MYALTIAGGRGERLKPLTDNLPKPMVDIAGKPLLQHQANMLISGGVTDIIFLCGYRAEAIQNYFGDGSKFGFRAHYSLEEQPLGRGGALRKGLQLVPESEKAVAAINGDILTTQPLQELLQQHRRLNAIATVMLTPYPNTYGVVESADGIVSKFSEKTPLPHWINAGVYILSRSIEKLLPERGDHEDSTFPQLAREGRLACVQSRKPWRAVDNFKDRSEAEQMAADGILHSGR